MAAGYEFTCAILESDGSVRCWGDNTNGQLGDGDTPRRGDEPGEMGLALPAVDLGEAARSVSCGAAHTCALTMSGRVKCWGANAHGQLGSSGPSQVGDAPGQMGNALAYMPLSE